MTKRSKPPTLAEIAEALELTTRRVSQLKVLGMPVTSIASAQEWRKAHASEDDSVSELRRRRIGLLRQQERRAKLDADERAGLLMPKAEVADQHRRIAFAVQAHLRRLESEIPQLCLGLPLSASKPLVKKFIRETQLTVAQNHPDFWPAVLPPGWEI